MTKLGSVFLLLISACAVDPVEEDGRDDSFTTDGKADTGGITNGSPEAIAVLRVANERPAAEMHSHGVATRAANNIVAARAGDDETVGTGDDVVFTTLAQLDAVPYVGPAAFARLLAYADDLGYLMPLPAPSATPADVWHVASCPPISWAQLVAKFPAGGWRYDFEVPYTTVSRRRESCNLITGCTPWIPDGMYLQMPSGTGHGLTVPTATRRDVQMRLDTRTSEIIVDMSPLIAPSGAEVTFTCSGIGAAGVGPIRCAVEGMTAATFDGWRTGGPLKFERANELLVIDGTICSDGRFHFASPTPTSTADEPKNLGQIAVYGSL